MTKQSQQSDEQLLGAAEAAEMLKVSPGTLAVWRSSGRYALPFVKVGRHVRYRVRDIEGWLETRSR